ncbi:MAG: TlpA family protein disulfide reductase [Rhodocyclaceae bacterium]|nr:TlpA family protein disulfide reductase [Rhodocyclaceae bacterium]
MNGARIALAAFAVAAIAAWAGYWINQSNTRAMPASDPALLRLSNAPLKTLDGRPRSLADWRGKVLVVNFWATWCPPCRAEMPGFSRISEQYASKGVQFLGIAIDDEAPVQAYSRHAPVSYPLLLGDGTTLDLTAQLGNATQGLPFTAIIDSEGRLTATKVGILGEAELQARLDAILARQ